MISIRSVLREVPDPRGRQGLLHPLHALPTLMPLSTLDGRRGMMTAFRLGRDPIPRRLRPSFRPRLPLPRDADRDAAGRRERRGKGRACAPGVRRGRRADRGPHILARMRDEDPGRPAAHRRTRPDRHDRHRGCGLPSEINDLAGRGEGRGPHPDGEEEPEGAAKGDRARLRRAGASPRRMERAAGRSARIRTRTASITPPPRNVSTLPGPTRTLPGGSQHHRRGHSR